MSGKNKWTLEQLKTRLRKRREIKAWIITLEHVHRRERYFMMDGGALVTDQDRDVDGESVHLKIAVHLNGKPGRQGEITKKLFQALPLDEQLELAIEAALQTDHQAWELPSELPAGLPEPKTSDPRMAEDLETTMRELSREVEKAVAAKRPAVFNSAELFLSLHDLELHLSNGLSHRSSQSRIYSESAYSFSRKNAKTGRMESDEYMSTRWAVNRDDLRLDRLFEETSDRAAHSLDTRKPGTGKYSVIIDSEVLSTLFNGQLLQLSGANAYNGLPFLKPGEELIPGADGDLITLTLDPLLDYGADTGILSDQGVAQAPLTLVERNRIVATSMDKQYADYLGRPVTSARGNVVLSPGSLSYEELTRQGPQVLEILQFSGLFADPNSGTFSSEIRLARLFDNVRGSVSYLKGGSLSGSISENFKRARFSSKSVKVAHFSSGAAHGHGYHGPEFALLSDVSIVG